ncbi:MAG: hypothetical protein AABY46_07305 [Nitrospirota bacterium]
MTLIPRACLHSGGAWTPFIPPYNLSVIVRPALNVIHRAIPFAATKFVYGTNREFDIEISGEFNETTIAAGLTVQDSLLTALLGSGWDTPQTVHFARWYDSAGIYKGIYRTCEVIDGPVFERGKGATEKHRRFSFKLKCRGGRAATEPGGTQPGTSPYEAHLPSGITGGTVAVPIAQYYQALFEFDDMIEVTDATNVSIMQKEIVMLGDGASMIAKGLYCAGARMAGAGATIIKISNLGYAGAGNVITLTIPALATTAALVTGTLTITAGSKLYAFCTQAGGHAGLKIMVPISS